MKFVSDINLIKTLELPADMKISTLPQLYRSSMEFAEAQGNEELNRILAQLPKHPEYKYASIDSRTHMLMTGMFPCIPGWHCDDFYRTEELSNQPDLEKVHDVAPAIHYILVLGTNSRTEFTVEDLHLPSPAEIQKEYGSEAPVYLHYDRILEESKPKTIHLDSGKLYSFGPTAFHRGQGATENGWRFFLRVTFSNHRFPKDEVRYQTQVYTSGRVSW